MRAERKKDVSLMLIYYLLPLRPSSGSSCSSPDARETIPEQSGSGMGG